MWYYFAFTNFELFLYVVAHPLDIRKIFAALSSWWFLTTFNDFWLQQTLSFHQYLHLLPAHYCCGSPLITSLCCEDWLFLFTYCLLLGKCRSRNVVRQSFFFIVNVLLLFLAELYFIFHMVKQRWLLCITFEHNLTMVIYFSILTAFFFGFSLSSQTSFYRDY